MSDESDLANWQGMVVVGGVSQHCLMVTGTLCAPVCCPLIVNRLIGATFFCAASSCALIDLVFIVTVVLMDCRVERDRTPLQANAVIDTDGRLLLLLLLLLSCGTHLEWRLRAGAWLNQLCELEKKEREKEKTIKEGREGRGR